MSALRHLKRTVQRANRDTCNHPRPRFKVGVGWDPNLGPEGYTGRRATCADCGVPLLATKRVPLPVTEPEPTLEPK